MNILITLFWLGLIIAVASTIFSLVMSVPIIIIGIIASIINLIIEKVRGK